VRSVQQSAVKIVSGDVFHQKGNHDRRIMLFDLSIRGHHPNYIQQLIRYWHEQAVPARLEIVVSPGFLVEHADVVEFAASLTRQDIRLTAITPEEEAGLQSRKSFISRTKRAFQELELLRRYAVIVGATHCLMMYFDTFQIPLATGIQLPCPFSGIYFRPTFHYSAFDHYQPSWKEQLQQWREAAILSRVLQHPQCHGLFCLDPFAVQYLQTRGQNHVVHLPDPVSISTETGCSVQSLQAELGVDPTRRVFLLFGALTGRKGIHQLLDAIARLPTDLSQQVCLLLVGEIKSTEKPGVEAKIAALRQSLPVQIITHYEFVPDHTIPGYFQLADVVLAPYQHHVGMSGILLLAAAAKKPVLSSSYGLMGEFVRRYQLGIAVDSTLPAEIAAGLTRFLTEPTDQLGDHARMQDFAEQNSADLYSRTIFQHLMTSLRFGSATHPI
jgi:glycosyltransferase involved in cell wall biosynthesis